MQQLKPNLFVVGAPKCGTTSLCYYLGQHSEIFICDPKEPFYFGRDFTKANQIEEEYLRLFNEGVNQRYRCEGSTWYLFSRTAAKEIYEFNPGSKIIIMIRNPTEVLQSLIEQRIYDRTESISTLEEALELEPERKKGNSLPSTRWKLPKEKYYYSEVPLFAEQIERYFQVFGRKNVRVLKFEEFIRHTPKVLAEIEHFLQLDNFHGYNLKIKNQRKVLQSPGLKDTLLSLPAPVRKLVHLLTPISFRKWIFGLVDSLNRTSKKSRIIPDDLRAELVKRYKNQEEKLGQLLADDFNGFVK